MCRININYNKILEKIKIENFSPNCGNIGCIKNGWTCVQDGKTSSCMCYKCDSKNFPNGCPNPCGNNRSCSTEDKYKMCNGQGGCFCYPQ